MGTFIKFQLRERKQASARMINKDHLKFGFKIEKVDDDNYYGFRVDNDHRYFTGDFIVHHNCGGNGKSKILELFELCFGDYCCKLPITIITRARGGGEAASPVARTKGKRFACLQEPEANESINVGLMKELVVILSWLVVFIRTHLSLSPSLK